MLENNEALPIAFSWNPGSHHKLKLYCRLLLLIMTSLVQLWSSGNKAAAMTGKTSSLAVDESRRVFTVQCRQRQSIIKNISYCQFATEALRSEKMPVVRGLAILMISVMIFVHCGAVMEVGINNEPAYTDARSIIEDFRIEQAKTRQVCCDWVQFLLI